MDEVTHAHDAIVCDVACVARCPSQTLVGHPRTPWSVKFHPTDPRYVASGCLGFQVRYAKCMVILVMANSLTAYSHSYACVLLCVGSGTLRLAGVSTSRHCGTRSSRSRSTRQATSSQSPAARASTRGTTRYKPSRLLPSVSLVSRDSEPLTADTARMVVVTSTRALE